MADTRKHSTICTICGREVGVVPDWERLQSGRHQGEYRVTRHAADARRTNQRPERRTICAGSRILIHVQDVSVADGGTLPAQSPGQSHGG